VLASINSAARAVKFSSGSNAKTGSTVKARLRTVRITPPTMDFRALRASNLLVAFYEKPILALIAPK